MFRLRGGQGSKRGADFTTKGPEKAPRMSWDNVPAGKVEILLDDSQPVS